jgi:hypothetical protein
MGAAYMHVCGDDYLLEHDNGEWIASVPCWCPHGTDHVSASWEIAGTDDWHWHDVAWEDTFTGLVTVLAVRQVLEGLGTGSDRGLRGGGN